MRVAGRGVAAVAASVAFGGAMPLDALAQTSPRSAGNVERAMTTYQPVDFSVLPGWSSDDHLAAFRAFVLSSRRLTAIAAGGQRKLDAATLALLPTCHLAVAAAATVRTAAEARQFFETHFVAQRVVHGGPEGLLTAYYEPLIKGARVASERFAEPIYRRPADLVNIVDESQRGAAGSAFTHMRKTAAGLVPFPTRAQIEAGALKGQGLELFYLADPVEVFFLQVQGSGRIEFADGTRVRVAYDGKNGHPYTSVGRYLIDAGIIDAARMSLEALGTWLRADRERGQAAMQQNASYVFFRQLTGEAAKAPVGVLDIPLTTGRSLAVDPAHQTIGSPVYVSSTALTHISSAAGFHRLMIAQDVGSAIKGPERGDLYLGSGDAAGKLAGITKHPGVFFVLAPRATAPETTVPSKTP